MTRLTDKKIIQSPQSSGTSLAADFQEQEFDVLFRDKGYNVIHERAIQCACKGKGSDSLSSCQNCGGSGWFFVNPTQTRMIITSMQLDRQYDEQARLDVGMAYITSRASDKIAFMDKISLIDSLTVHHEVLFPQLDTSIYRASTHYDIKDVEYIGLYNGDKNKLIRLQEGTDYTYSNNVIDFGSIVVADDKKITIRYRHNPVFHIWDNPRETAVSLLVKGSSRRDVLQLAVKGIGKRSHMIANAENWIGNRLLDNSWEPECPPAEYSKLETIVRNSSASYLWSIMTPSQKQDILEIGAPTTFDFTFDETFA